MAFSDFGKNVKKKLVDIDKTQNWLIEQVRKETGLYCDSAYMSRIMTGEREPPKIIQAIRKILDLTD